METKREIRKQILKVRDSLSKEEIQKKSRQIFDILKTTSEYQNAERILYFSGYMSEPDTGFMMEDSIKEGKSVYCPLVIGNTMDFFKIQSLFDLYEGYKGILEPLEREEDIYLSGQNPKDLIIMPGVAFDRDKNRIGYGKGFYDRFLERGFKGPRIAICFDLQIIDNNRIPFEETDIKPHLIITETGRV